MIVTFLLLSGLFLVSGCDGGAESAPTTLQCEAVALSGAGGAPDSCDLSACRACVDNCGSDCLIQESYPPQYACDSASWSVYDFCPGWLPPSEITATNVENLGCGDGVESLTAAGSSSGVAVTHLGFSDGCCPQEVRVDVAVSGSTISVSYALIEDLCDCSCQLDVSYQIEGVPTGDYTLVAGPAGTTTTVSVP